MNLGVQYIFTSQINIEGEDVMYMKHITLPSQGIRLYESNHRDGNVINEHQHEVHQILYALQGEGKVNLNGKDYSFEQDHVAIILPYTTHSILSNSKLTVLVLAFDQFIFPPYIKNDLLDRYFSTTQLKKLNPLEGSSVRQLLRKMLFEQSQDTEINYLASKIYLSEFLLNLAKSIFQPTSIDANTWRAERLRNYIDTNFYDISGCDELAIKLGISTRHMNNIFKECYEVTPTQYLTEVRISKAKKLLLETEKDIVTICFEVGFESVSTFYRIFKVSTNVSPNKYRTLTKEYT